MAKNLEQLVQKILESAGITINGNNPWDIRVRDNRFYKRVLRGGKLAFAEAYMAGWWDTNDTMSLHLFFEKILRARVDEQAAQYLDLPTQLTLARVKLLDRFSNRQSTSKSRRVSKQHYDIGNELYQLMLDKRMVYSCADFEGMEDQRDLDQAHVNKLNESCREVGLEPDMNVVDVGCGFGGWLIYAAQNYRVRGAGITISHEQANLARELCKGLPIEIRVEDYRDLEGQYDVAVSFGMAEHVGRRNHRSFYQKISDCLIPGGKFFYRVIGKNTSEFTYDPFIDKWIFPGGELLSLAQMIEPSEGIFKVISVKNKGRNYNPTLICWDERFMGNWEEIKRLGNGKYDDSFKNGWHYYLSSSASAFRVGNLQVYQIVFEKPGVFWGL